MARESIRLRSIRSRTSDVTVSRPVSRRPCRSSPPCSVAIFSSVSPALWRLALVARSNRSTRRSSSIRATERADHHHSGYRNGHSYAGIRDLSCCPCACTADRVRRCCTLKIDKNENHVLQLRARYVLFTRVSECIYV